MTARDCKRAVPRGAAVSVGAFPIVGLALFPAGAALAAVGFGACALTLRRGAIEVSPADPSAPRLTPARARVAVADARANDRIDEGVSRA